VSALQIARRALVALIAAASLHAVAQVGAVPGVATSPAGAASPAAGKADSKIAAPVAPASLATDASAAADRKPGSSVRVGMDQPIAVVPATSDETTVRVLLRDSLGDPPSSEELSAGLLTSTSQANQVSRPEVVLLDKELVKGTQGDYVATIRVKGIVGFGESSAPLFYRGRQVEVLRFSKVGLALRVNAGGYMARENAPLALTLDNPSSFEYGNVRARLRVGDRDVCDFSADIFPRAASSANAPASGAATTADAPVSGGKVSGPLSPTPSADPGAAKSGWSTPSDSCQAHLGWSSFRMPRYAAVTLRIAAPPPAWFLDPVTDLARSAKRHGLLTLRFEGDSGAIIHEQNLPIEVQFEPSATSLSTTLLRVAACLLAGALLSLFLHVSVPNIKRKSVLKDQLAEAAKLTSAISSEVDSTLRVLLRVERLALDEIRQSEWPIGPSYALCAQRVEQALPPFRRRIDAVRRLDATLIRLKLAITQNPGPTRIEQIENYVASASEVLKQDSLSDEDWVFVNQRLEAAQKLLREPTQAEKEAFEGLLSGRWKAIKEHFNVTPTGALVLPPALMGMESCVPAAGMLPRPDDPDALQWIRAVGPTRADLQLYALILLWDFEFLLPTAANDHWIHAKNRMKDLLATPVLTNLREAKSLLRRSAEDISEDDIILALREGIAEITMDPAIPRPNQRIRFSVCFRDAHLNSAAARELVTCYWTFEDRRQAGVSGAIRKQWQRVDSRLAFGNLNVPEKPLGEQGWSVHHYFERDVDHSDISVKFSKSTGEMITLLQPQGDTDEVWYRKSELVERSRRAREGWQRFWIEMLQLGAALLVPLGTLASQTVSDANAVNWWQLVVIGFASDTIKSILVGRQDVPARTGAATS